MSLVGATIDYGPYGFMEHFDPDFVPNGSDGTGRYRYSDQPDVSDNITS
jgi:serine/tyrosine/threonine adenylyltransferase